MIKEYFRFMPIRCMNMCKLAGMDLQRPGKEPLVCQKTSCGSVELFLQKTCYAPLSELLITRCGSYKYV